MAALSAELMDSSSGVSATNLTAYQALSSPIKMRLFSQHALYSELNNFRHNNSTPTPMFLKQLAVMFCVRKRL
jgi:hypothetical protein